MNSDNETESPTYGARAYNASADLGDMACGDLVLAINQAMQPLAAGQVLRVRALDPGAQIDIPAWCRMRGHTLLAEPVASGDEFYFIRKGEPH